MKSVPRFVGGPGIANHLSKVGASGTLGWFGGAGGSKEVNVCRDDYSAKTEEGVYKAEWACLLSSVYWKEVL